MLEDPGRLADMGTVFLEDLPRGDALRLEYAAMLRSVRSAGWKTTFREASGAVRQSGGRFDLARKTYVSGRSVSDLTVAEEAVHWGQIVSESSLSVAQLEYQAIGRVIRRFGLDTLPEWHPRRKETFDRFNAYRDKILGAGQNLPEI